MKINLFHGSDTDFTDFDINQSKKWGKFGIWFSNDEEFAEMFGTYVKQVTVTLNNPKIISASKWDDIRSKHAKDTEWFINWKKHLISQGHDALQINGGKEKFSSGMELNNPMVIAVFSTNQIEKLNENIMKKIKITEQQYEKLKLNIIKEDFSSGDNEGNVVVKKDTNPSDIKKLTDKGLNVSLIDEKLSEEQPITYKHKFDGKKLNIYVTKEKGRVEDIMEYTYSIKDQDQVNKCFENDNVFLLQKEASSGRYKDMGKVAKKYYKNVSGFNNFRVGATGHVDNTLLVEPATDSDGGGE